ncbi:MAG: ATP-binding protein, partial [Proteobacteria bacterium]|nr:ATP-binding protein [Pseudomonadota bacterium]
FTRDEVAELLSQHTAATGQPFGADAVGLVHELSQGHPWLVNALADQMVRDVWDRSVVLLPANVEAAKETIIRERRTHIDSLLARLHEERVQRIITPMLLGERTGHDVLNDDFSYVVGLGIVALRKGRYEIANPIYREVIPRALSFDQQAQLDHDPTRYITANGCLDVGKLLREFQTFWREDGHLAAGGFSYREAGPHLMLMAFLQRVVNSGGQVQREYGLGRGRLDLVVAWHGEQHVIEIKLRRDTMTEARAAKQLAGYLDGLGLTEGYLVLFDLRQGPSWEEKLYENVLEIAGKRVLVLGC